MDMYNLVHDAYYGSGGFLSGAYLTRHPRETDKNYRTRIQSSYYLNYFAPIVNALVDPVFKKKPFRDWSGSASAMMNVLTEDVDAAGTNINDFMKRAALSAKLYGATLIVVEMFTTEDQPGSLDEMLRERRLPYAYTLDPDRVTDYAIDKNGKLLNITFTDIAVKSTENDHERTVHFDENAWEIRLDGRVISSGEHGLGVVPVIFFPSQDVKQGGIHPVPELYAEAQASLALYNHCSWLTEILKNQTFPLLTFPSKLAKDLVIGTNNALCFDGDTARFAPAFIAPPSDPAQVIQSQIKLLIEEMYRMAGLTFVTGTKEEASGIARQWEFERTNQRLAEFAARCAHAEKRMFEIAARWMKQDLKYTVSYSSDFGISDIATELKNAQAVMDMNMGAEMKLEVARHVLASYAPDISAERFDSIMKDMEKTLRESAYNEPALPGEP